MLHGLPVWLEAGLWGLLGGSSLLIGAAFAYLISLPKRVTAGIMAFGCGVLISAVAYDLIMEGFEAGGIMPVAGGALAGSLAYTIANGIIARGGGHHRKRSGDQQRQASTAEQGAGGGGMAIAVGSLLDGVPESVVLGVGLLGGGVSAPMLAAVFLSNLPEGLSSATGMRKAGRSRTYVFSLWAAIAAASGLSALLGAALLGNAPPSLIATVNAIAAGALLTMVADTMIPEAVEGERIGTGLLAVSGFLVAFALSGAGA
jgi:ZIP family zinc transporter